MTAVCQLQSTLKRFVCDINVFWVFKICPGIRGIQRTSHHDHWKHKNDLIALKVKKYRFCQNEAPNYVGYFE